MDRIRKNVHHLTRGCTCNKNRCLNRQCKCKKNDQLCGPGCTCRNCENIPVVIDKPTRFFQDDIDTDSNESLSSSEDSGREDPHSSSENEPDEM